MSTRQGFRPRAVDANRQLAIVRDESLLDKDESGKDIVDGHGHGADKVRRGGRARRGTSTLADTLQLRSRAHRTCGSSGASPCVGRDLQNAAALAPPQLA